MSTETCTYCGCPQFDSYSNGPRHYKGCEALQHARRTFKVMSVKDSGEILIKRRQSEIRDVLAEIEEIRDCIKDACLDEVYECRWDCITERLMAA